MSSKKVPRSTYKTKVSEAGTKRKVKKDGALYPLYGQEKALNNIDLLRNESKYLTYDQLAGLIKISPNTLRKAIKEYPEVAIAIGEGRAIGAREAGKKLYEKAVIDGDLRALTFYLERYCDRKQGISLEMDDVTDKANRLQNIEDWYNVEYGVKDNDNAVSK